MVSHKAHQASLNELEATVSMKTEDIDNERVLEQDPEVQHDISDEGEESLQKSRGHSEQIFDGSEVSVTENKPLSWGSESKSIIKKLSPVRRDPDSSLSPSAMSHTLGRSNSRSQSPEITEKPKEKKKSGPKIKLRLK